MRARSAAIQDFLKIGDEANALETARVHASRENVALLLHALENDAAKAWTLDHINKRAQVLLGEAREAK